LEKFIFSVKRSKWSEACILWWKIPYFNVDMPLKIDEPPLESFSRNSRERTFLFGLVARRAG
jgi:hypothetical protein